jgi:predicted small lipoprotein YifL
MTLLLKIFNTTSCGKKAAKSRLELPPIDLISAPNQSGKSAKHGRLRI